MNAVQIDFQQAQLSEAAYANFMAHPGDPQAALRDTANNMSFSTAQAAAFTTHWRVVDQYTASAWGGLTDGSGFSATLFESLAHPGEYSFAIRGSTPSGYFKDFQDDFKLITTDGIAVQQLVDLYNYWTSLTSGPNAYQAAMLSTQFTATGFLRTLYAGSVAQVPDTLRTLFGGVNSVDFYDVARAVFLANGYIVEGGTVYQLEWGDSQSVLPGSHITVGLNKLPSGASVSVARPRADRFQSQRHPNPRTGGDRIPRPHPCGGDYRNHNQFRRHHPPYRVRF